MRLRTPTTLSFFILLAACELDLADREKGFREGEPDDQQQNDDPPQDDPPPNDPPQDDPPPNDPPQDDPPPNDPPPNDPPPNDPPPNDPPQDDPPADDDGPLHTALTDCVFNLVWTKGPHYNLGTGLTLDQVASYDADSLEFLPSHLNAWVFPGVHGESVLSLDLLGVDAVTGEYILGGKVTGPEAVLALPELRLDPAAPIVLTDATIQDPASTGPAVLTSLLDDSETVLEGFTWGLIVDLNGGPNPACEPLLEQVFGPF